MAKTMSDATPLPLLYLLTTGGTIAGKATDATQTTDYTAGVLNAAELLAAVPAIHEIARLSSEAVANIDSKDMTEALWRKLAKRVAACLDDPKTAGVVITHGTDTLEETAYFLSLTLPATKPVVLTGAMRPATAISADGPANLLNAARLAVSPAARDRGVLVTMNDEIFSPASVTKRSPSRLDAFAAPNGGADGAIVGGKIAFFHPLLPTALRFPIPEAPLPKVIILYGYAGDDGVLVSSAVASGAKGIVYAGSGMGSLPLPVEAALIAAQKAGTAVVRASRLPGGLVISPPSASPFIASGALSPVKARILLQFALTQKSDPAALQDIFRCAAWPSC